MDPSVRISNMDALLFTLSLEVVLLQMRILEGCTELRAQGWKLASKHEKLQCEKLVRDRQTIKDVIRRTLIEVADSGVWPTLQQAIDDLRQQASSAMVKRLDHEQLKMSLNTIAEELTMKRNQWATDLRNADQKIAIIKDKINDDLANANARLRYTEKLLLARAESLELEYAVQHVPLPRTDHEQRVHDELLKAYELEIKERQDSLEYWHQRYTVDTARINERLTTKCEELRVATARRIELQKIFNLHEGEMRSWLTFKRERAARLAREARLKASATRIQAWWRGVMVRRALGAFRHLRNSKKSAIKPKKK